MDWPAYFPDLNLFEHLWDALERRYAARLHHPENTQQLKQMLIVEWALLPQEMLHQLVLSMRRRREATIAMGEGIYYIKDHLLVVFPVGSTIMSHDTMRSIKLVFVRFHTVFIVFLFQSRCFRHPVRT
ncbi:transposable element Tcb2 transposase [Trichonephila clavipes]|nr:transposable element Tcb2 transposase [Trichonephila clavipes]